MNTAVNQRPYPIQTVSQLTAHIKGVLDETFADVAVVVGKKYVFSAWGKLRNPNVNTNSFTDNVDLTAVINLKMGTGIVQTFTVTSKGQPIEGWQRFYGEFTIPSTGVDNMDVVFTNSGASGRNGFIDDVRIHPYDASMVSYVYDPVSYKLVSELDANNYASFLGYEEQGSVSNAKKETAYARFQPAMPIKNAPRIPPITDARPCAKSQTPMESASLPFGECERTYASPPTQSALAIAE